MPLLVFAQLLHIGRHLITLLAVLVVEGSYIICFKANGFNCCWQYSHLSLNLTYPMRCSFCRSSLAFRLMPQANAILDCSPISAAGHVIPHSYVPISVSQFMDDLSAEEDVLCNRTDNVYVSCLQLDDITNSCAAFVLLFLSLFF